MPASHKIVLCLLPLLAAGCAAATATPATRIGDGAAPEVRFARVSSQSMVMQLGQPAHAAILEVRPGPFSVASWLEGREIHELPAGAHTVALSRRNPRLSRTPCNGPGEQLYHGTQRPVGARRVREVWLDGQQLWCVQIERNVLVVVSPLPVEYGRLEELVSAFNTRYAGLDVDAETLSRDLAEMLSSAWAGSAGYSLRVPG